MLKPAFSQGTANLAARETRETLKNVLPNCCCLIKQKNMPALHSGCAREGKQAKLGGGKLRGSLGQSGFVKVLMVCQLLLNFFTGLQKLLQICLTPVLSFLSHTEPTPRTDSLVWHRLDGKVFGLASPGGLFLAIPPGCFEQEEGGCPLVASPWASKSDLPGSGNVRLCLHAAGPSAEKHSRQNLFQHSILEIGLFCPGCVALVSGLCSPTASRSVVSLCYVQSAVSAPMVSAPCLVLHNSASLALIS